MNDEPQEDEIYVDWVEIEDTPYRVSLMQGKTENNEEESLVMHQPVSELLDAQESHRQRRQELYDGSDENLYGGRMIDEGDSL